MADAFQVLLQATVDHLREEKRRGVRHLDVDPGMLSGLERADSTGGKDRTEAGPRGNQHRQRQSTPSGQTSARPQRRISIGIGGGDDSKREVRSAGNLPQMETGAIAKSAAPESGGGPATGEKPRGADHATLDALREAVLPCSLCPHLVSSRTQVVFGVGNPDAALMFVGEAPGVDEDRQGEPFVGKAGQLLTRIIGAMGLSREEVYIANVLKCRPDTPGQRFGNRKPTFEEMEQCKPWLLRQIELVQPSVIVALGATALQGLFGSPSESITRARGQWRDFKGIALMPTYHPSYLLHKESVPDQAKIEKRRVWEDMLQVMEKLDLPISEKQRNYFR